jgi:hypothetical protein
MRMTEKINGLDPGRQQEVIVYRVFSLPFHLPAETGDHGTGKGEELDFQKDVSLQALVCQLRYRAEGNRQ